MLGICLVCAYFFIPFSKVRLGLDLKGGVHYELEVQGQEALAMDLEETRALLQDQFVEKGHPGAVVSLEEGALHVRGVSQPAASRVLAKAPGYASQDKAGHIVLVQKPDHQRALKKAANDRALQIIETRVNQFGVVEPEITRGGAEGNRIIVELPGVEEGDRDRIKRLLSTPGRLELRMLAKADRPYFPTKEEALAHFGGELPPGLDLCPEPEPERPAKGSQSARDPGPGAVRRWILLEQRTQFDGAAITDARQATSEMGLHEVQFSLNQAGAEANARVTGLAAEEGRLFAFVLDRKVVSVLSAREKILGGSVRISGQFSAEEAEDLALKLRSGALRASMKILEERVVGPSLGKDSIRLGLGSSALGFGVIVAFMVFWYRWSGVNAVIALAVNVIVMLGLLGSFRATLTLPGIAGFALTVGMAVDANILIFERIKEEMALGRAVPEAIRAGFDRVFWTIVDSHVTQLFAALLLFIFGTGPVKGFAVSLTVGVAASLFTSIYISRFIYDWLLERNPRAATLSIGVHDLFKGVAIDFMKYRKVALALSWGIILACTLVVKPWRTAGNEHIQLGMQFVGGTEMTVRFLAPVEAEDVRTALEKGGFPGATVVAYEHGEPGIREFSIKVKPQKQGDAAHQSDRVKAVLKAMDGDEAALPALNLEGSNALADRLAVANPLGLKGDEQAVRTAYEGFAGQVTGRREKLPAGLYRGFAELPAELPSAVRDLVEREYRPGKIGILKDESFSASISGEWTRKTLAAVAWAMAAILLYVVFRFTTAFAVGGIIALVHDMLMALALFAVLGYEFNVPVVASFLTLMGYSMADTIVVFDRIRENTHKPEYRHAPFTRIINDSINQTLSRTVLTSLSVLFVSVCLWLWGGPALRDLAFPLVVGVLTGTYSSIYIASPVVAWWQRFVPSQDRLAAS
ncbi:protein translocase subunit SecD [Geothrix sp. 21YS21S-2]|uniref:protein translocase subunit SecD n=1 Tax=Geothrix sp. 21YS21S-2 TaxID=3068893 RepID=UPI0027BA0CF0|nr:protein translocase subunit SecD [Geothrix sp. 21YS21S-2]